jgi:hypothetical protein
MDIKEFIQNYREAFGEKAQLPLLFGYSDKPIGDTEKIGGCFFKGLQTARDGRPVSLSADVIGCGGGKLYTGFSDMPERVPGFVSLKEKYKKTPEMVVDYVNGLGMKRAEKPYLNFIRIDKAEYSKERKEFSSMLRPTCSLDFAVGLSLTLMSLMRWCLSLVQAVALWFL